MRIKTSANPLRDMLVFLYVSGLALSGISAFTFVKSRDFQGKALHAQGTVIALQEAFSTHGTNTFPVVAFRTVTGGRMTFVSRVPNQSQFPVGSRVDVLYDDSDPTNARMDTLVELWGPTFLFGAIGLGFLALGTVVAVMRPKALRRVPSA